MSQEFNTENVEYYIIKSMLESDTFCRNFVTKMSSDMFSNRTQDIVKGVIGYFNKYSKTPTLAILEDNILPKIHKNDATRKATAEETISTIGAIDYTISDGQDWILDETKKFIRTRKIMNAIVTCADLVNDHKHEEIVSIMEKAFQVNFDESFGTEYFAGLEERAIRAEEPTEVMSTGIPSLDSRIGGGYRRKSMFVFAGPANVGKTLVLNDAASTLALIGYNVLYLSLELSEDYISQRTDAKFAGVAMDDINVDPKFAIEKAISRRDKMNKDGKPLGQLYYKEYPPNAVSSNDIRALLKNLEIKKEFKPDFIVVDYLKLIKPNGRAFADNTYGQVVTVCEELRSLAMEYNACVISAAQTGRQSYGQSAVGMEDISDSIGIAQTVDVLVTLARNSEIDEGNDILLNIAKSRFSRNGGSFLAKVNYKYMRIEDADQPEDEYKKFQERRPDKIGRAHV